MRTKRKFLKLKSESVTYQNVKNASVIILNRTITNNTFHTMKLKNKRYTNILLKEILSTLIV